LRSSAVFDRTEFHGNFTILLNKTHNELCKHLSKQHDTDKKICRVCACIYAAIMATVLTGLFSAISFL